jgi:predicted AlkP superfamily phosphohydrolase/phosphomutase
LAVRTKLLVIGIDAANATLIRHWAHQGVLPNISSLIRAGRTATVRGVDGFFTGATWPSLLTGTNPARHGIHYLAQLVPGSYQFARPHDAEYIRAPLFWEALSKAGKRIAILDVPLAKLDPKVNGIQIVEWAGHDCLFGFQTSPSELAGEILSNHGSHPVPSNCDSIERTPGGFGHFVDTLIAGVEAKAKLTCDLLMRDTWDLFLQVFTESHCIGHQGWHLHDPSHPAHDPDMAATLGNPVQRVYKAIDKAVGEVIVAAGRPPVLLVFPHGMSHALGRHQLLPEVLCRLGLSVALPSPPDRRGPMEAVRAIGRRLPSPARSAVRRWLQRTARPGSFKLPRVSVDTQASRCFVVPNGLLISGIRLNLAGREPDGIVQPGKEAETLFHDLARDLLAIREERTQAPLVQRVFRTADLYEGPNLDRLPDILVEWRDGGAVGTTALPHSTNAVIRASSPKIGTVETVNRYGRTGEHRSDGLLVASGPGVEASNHDLSISIFDVAPTITAALGVKLTTADGKEMDTMIPTARLRA